MRYFTLIMMYHVLHVFFDTKQYFLTLKVNINEYINDYYS